MLDADGNPVVLGVFHPTFLYEAIFCVLLAGLLVWLDRRYDFRRGAVLALYVAGYPVGRGVIEFMRTDEANHVLGLRVNSWVSILVFILGVGLFFWYGPTAGRTRARDRSRNTGQDRRVSAFGMSCLEYRTLDATDILAPTGRRRPAALTPTARVSHLTAGAICPSHWLVVRPTAMSGR